MLQGRILTPDGWIDGSIAFDQRIASITEGPAGAGLTIIPGFVDLHVHGASGVDIMEGGDAGAVVARSHARHGTTALLGTTLTAKEDSIRHALQGLAGVIAQRPQHGARMLGVHLQDASEEEAEMPIGTGEGDFKLLGEYLPKDAERVLEIGPRHGRAEILASVQYLLEHGF